MISIGWEKLLHWLGLSKKTKRQQWKKVPQRKKQRLLNAIIARLEKDPQSLKLLKGAMKDKVRIGFAPELIDSNTAAFYRISDNQIGLCPYQLSGELETPEHIAPSLAHELRHYWQSKKMKLTPENNIHINRNPRLSLIFNRVIEADAYAFQDRCRKRLDGKKMSRQEEAKILRRRFLAVLRDNQTSRDYDTEKTRDLHAVHTSPAAGKKYFDEVKDMPALTVAEIKKLLRAGLTDKAPLYFTRVSDRRFENLILRHAHPGAKKAVEQMEAFKIAGAGNDNKKAQRLRRAVQKEIRHLPRNGNPV